MLRGGCAWRLLPHESPSRPTVYHYFRAWRLDGTWERVDVAVRERVRAIAGREATPDAAIADSQSARTTQRDDPRLGRGQESERPQKAPAGGYPGLGDEGQLTPCGPREVRWREIASGASDGGLPAPPPGTCGPTPPTAGRSCESRSPNGSASRWRSCSAGAGGCGSANDEELESIPAGFEVIKRRWVVERTFAWITRNRRMSRYYEFLAETTEAHVYTCMIRPMRKRLAQGAA